MGAMLRAAVVGLCLTVLSGCSPAVKNQGRDGVEAGYSGRTLTARLPVEVRVPAVMAALDEVLRDRGYFIKESSVTEDVAKLVAHAPRNDGYPRVTVQANTTAAATVVRFTNEPFGDEELCRAMLDGLLVKLGM